MMLRTAVAGVQGRVNAALARSEQCLPATWLLQVVPGVCSTSCRIASTFCTSLGDLAANRSDDAWHLQAAHAKRTGELADYASRIEALEAQHALVCERLQTVEAWLGGAADRPARGRVRDFRIGDRVCDTGKYNGQTVDSCGIGILMEVNGRTMIFMPLASRDRCLMSADRLRFATIMERLAHLEESRTPLVAPRRPAIGRS